MSSNQSPETVQAQLDVGLQEEDETQPEIDGDLEQAGPQSDETVQSQLDGEQVEGNEEHNTPLEYVGPIYRILGGIDLDPCASKTSNLAETNIRETGGLEVNWGNYDVVFGNHPYAAGEPPKWLRKANEAIENGSETVVMLSKGDQSTEWFREYIEGEATLLCVPYERISFVGEENSAKWPNMYSVFGEVPDELAEWFESIGWVVYEP